MFDYTGYECKACKKVFSPDDDIVVCPECGTPYHRDCYKREGKCINTELHEKHISWKTDIESRENSEGAARCRSCGKVLRQEQLFCDNCGAPTEYFAKLNSSRPKSNADYSELYKEQGSNMSEMIYPYMVNYSDPLCGFDPEEEYENGLTTKDIADFVGTNTRYYLPKFKLMKTGGFKMSINISALFFPELYFAYRKMPLAALLIIVLKTAVALPATAVSMQLMFEMTGMTEAFLSVFPNLAEALSRLANADLNTALFNFLESLSTILNWIIVFFMGSFSNYYYYKYTLTKASEVKTEAAQSGADVSQSLRESGGTSLFSLLMLAALWFISKYAAMGLVFMLV